MPDLKSLIVQVGMSDEQIVMWVRSAVALAENDKEGWIISIHGYDNDPRELWDIPEVVRYMRHLVDDTPFLSALEVTTHMEIARGKRTFKAGFGAFECWALGHGHMTGKGFQVSQELWDEFKRALEASNKRYEQILKDPGYLGRIAGQRRLDIRPE